MMWNEKLTSYSPQKLFLRHEILLHTLTNLGLPYPYQLIQGEDITGWPQIQDSVQCSRVIYSSNGEGCHIFLLHKNT